MITKKHKSYSPPDIVEGTNQHISGGSRIKIRVQPSIMGHRGFEGYGTPPNRKGGLGDLQWKFLKNLE